MKNNKEFKNFELPLQKLSKKMDRKIRWQIFKAYWRKKLSFKGVGQMKWQLASVFVLLPLVVFGGYFGFKTYISGSESVIKGDFLYNWKRDMEVEKLAQLTTSEEKVDYYLELSNKRLGESKKAAKEQGYISGSFLPITYAAVPSEDFVIDENLNSSNSSPGQKLNLENDIYAQLVSESSFFNSLAIQESQNIQDVEDRFEKFEKIEKHLNEQEVVLAEMAAKSSLPEVAYETVVLVQETNQKNKEIVQEQQKNPKNTKTENIEVLWAPVEFKVNEKYYFWKIRELDNEEDSVENTNSENNSENEDSEEVEEENGNNSENEDEKETIIDPDKIKQFPDQIKTPDDKDFDNQDNNSENEETENDTKPKAPIFNDKDVLIDPDTKLPVDQDLIPNFKPKLPAEENETDSENNFNFDVVKPPVNFKPIPGIGELEPNFNLKNPNTNFVPEVDPSLIQNFNQTDQTETSKGTKTESGTTKTPIYQIDKSIWKLPNNKLPTDLYVPDMSNEKINDPSAPIINDPLKNSIEISSFDPKTIN